LLKQLRGIGVVPSLPPKIDNSAHHRIECRFARYLAQERGLARATLLNYLPVVRRFLAARFVTSAIRLKDLRLPDITQFILRHTRTASPVRVKLMVTALRSFFRSLYLRGDIDSDLAAAVPTVAYWRLATLPKFIPPEQVQRILRSCNQRTTTGQRDYTILLLLARLGLRAGEVVALRLDDIEWEAGELIIRGKGARRDRLPLPQDVGKALVRYLRDGRPCCSTRRVFICMKAPRRGFANSSDISTIVRRAIERAGLQLTHKGAHVLRHSLATEMLRKGASLAEIGEVLRHRCLNTTQIYAKVDLVALRTLAQPWPGGEA